MARSLASAPSTAPSIPAELDGHTSPQTLWAGVRIELVSNGWMVVEAAVAIAAGLLAHSVLLTAFGLDSVLELVTGGALLWRLLIEARRGSLARVERAENLAAWITGVGLSLLCVYVATLAIMELVTRTHAEPSPVGVGLAIVALILMPLLAWRKRRLAVRLGSAALRGDAACSITCAYMAAALLIGLALNVLLGWWWADALAALTLLIWLVPEAREALAGARAGRGACACGDDECQG